MQKPNFTLIPEGMLEEMKKQIDEIQSMVAHTINSNEGKEVLTTEEACEMLRISSRTLQNYRDSKLIPFSQYDRKIWFKRDDILHFVDSLRIEARRV